MSAKKSQRLINLFAKLIYSRYSHPTWTEIADEVEGYGDSESDTAKRMFERDKDVLRKLGIPLVSDCDEDGEYRYHINSDEYYLPDLSLTSDEFTLMGLALQFIQSVPELPLRQHVPEAALKMTFGLTGSMPPSDNGFRIVLGNEPTEKCELFDRAAGEGKRVSFHYRGIADAEARLRTIETYTRFYRHGAWYVSGRCLSHGGVRTFRIDRIAGTPQILEADTPVRAYEIPDFDEASLLANRYYWQGQGYPDIKTTVAEIVFAKGTPYSHLRRLGAQEGIPLEVDVVDTTGFLDWIISLGQSVQLIGPSELTGALTRRLERAAESLAQTSSAHDLDSEISPQLDHEMKRKNQRLEIKIDDQFERLLVLLPYLVSNPGVNVRDVCRRFGLTRKELFSDLDLIRMCGLPPYSPDAMIDCCVDDDDCIEILMADYLSRPARLTPGQATSILLSLDTLAKSPVIKDPGTIQRLITKITGLVNNKDTGEAESHRLPVWLDLDPGAAEEIVAAISKGVTDHKEIDIGYFAADGTETTRTVQPYSTVCFAGNWYLMAFCLLRKAFRTFRIDRIRPALLSDTGFTVDWTSVPKHLREGELFSSTAEIKYRVVIEAGRRVALLARPFSQIQSLGDDLYLITIETPSLEWIVPMVLQRADEVRVIAPKELARTAALQANKLLRMYNKVPAD